MFQEKGGSRNDPVSTSKHRCTWTYSSKAYLRVGLKEVIVVAVLVEVQ